MPSIVTANTLASGEVVYLASDGRWVRAITDAAIAATKADAAMLDAVAARAVDAREVTAVYAMDVTVVDGRPAPISVREKIRAALGPTV